MGVLALAGTRKGQVAYCAATTAAGTGRSARRSSRAGPSTTPSSTRATRCSTPARTTPCTARRCTARPTSARRGSAPSRRPARGERAEARGDVAHQAGQRDGYTRLGGAPGVLFRRTTAARASAPWTAWSSTRRGRGGTRAPAACAATRSSSTPRTRSGSTSRSPRQASSARRTAARPGCRATRTSPPTSCPRTSTPRSASASTAAVHPGRPERLWQQNHCGVYRSDDRATRGKGWTATACRATSAFPCSSTRATRTWPG